MNFTIEEFEHVKRALKLYKNIWNEAIACHMSIDNVLTDDDMTKIDELIKRISEEIAYHRQH